MQLRFSQFIIQIAAVMLLCLSLPSVLFFYFLRSSVRLFGLMAIILGWSIQVAAQGTYLRFDHMGAEDGLSQSSCLNLLQDRRGFIWVGTMDGLNLLDGREITVFRHHADDPQSLSGNYITDMVESPDGDIWVGTYNHGLNRLLAGTSQFERMMNTDETPNVLPSNRVNELLATEGGDLFIGTSKGVLFYDVDSGQTKPILFQGTEPSSQEIITLAQDHNQRVWMGAHHGLYSISPRGDDLQKVELPPQNGQPTTDYPLKILAQEDGTLLIGTIKGDVWRLFPDGEWRLIFRIKVEGYFDRNFEVNSLAIDHRGNYWAGTRGSGLFHYDPVTDKLSQYRDTPGDSGSLKSDWVYDLIRDRSDVLWIGTFGGLFKLPPNRLHFDYLGNHPDDPKGLGFSDVWAIFVDSKNQVWVGSESHGTLRLNPDGSRLQLFHDSENPRSHGSGIVSGIVETKDGRIFISTSGGSGLSEFQPDTLDFKHFIEPGQANSLRSVEINAMQYDPRGYLWLGHGQEGIARFDLETYQVTYLGDPELPGDLPDKEIWCLYLDTVPRLWIGTPSGVVRYHLVTGKMDRFQHNASDPKSLSNNQVEYILQTDNGTLWFATDGGLNQLLYEAKDPSESQFKIYTTDNGLPHNMVFALVEDRRGYLWGSTGRGIFRLDTVTGAVLSFSVNDGLQSNEFNSGSVAMDHLGRLYFGGTEGLTRFLPEDIYQTSQEPLIELTAIERNGYPWLGPRELLNTKKIELFPEDSFFSIKFSALDFVAPQDNRYRYKLENFNSDWVQDEEGSGATYTNLDPGEYTFKVMGTNSEGIWGTLATPLQIVVHPPFYLTTWAILFYIFAVVSIIVAYINFQNRRVAKEREISQRLREADRLKDEIFANTSHELRTPLNGIIGLSESLIEGAAGMVNEHVSRHLAMIAYSGRRLYHLVNDILDFSQMRSKTLPLHRKPMNLHAVVEVVLTLNETLIKNKDLKLINSVDPDMGQVYADENRLMQILHNLVGNAVKFTDKGMVKVTAQVEKNMVTTAVSDTGMGIPPEKQARIFNSFEQADGSITREFGGTGLGLAISKRLVELQGGEIRVVSTMGVGSTFSFTLPLYTDQADSEPSLETDSTAFLLSPANKQVSNPAHQPEEPSESQSEGTFTVLVVDDEPINLEVVANHLKPLGYRILKAASGTTALEIFEREPSIDLVLLDIMMPRMSGYEVCKQMRTQRPPHELPIVMLTAKDHINNLEMGFQLGANDYLTKPIQKKELTSRLKMHLQLLQSRKELELYSKTLEQQVEARTEEIQRANRELGAKNRELETLDGMVASLNREVHLSHLLQSVLEHCVTLVPEAEKGSFLLAEDGDLYRLTAVCGYPSDERMLGLTLTYDQVMTRYTGQRARQLDEDIYTLERVTNLPGSLDPEALPTPASVLAVFVPLDGKPKGVLVLDNFVSVEAFRDVDLVLLRRFRDHALSALSKTKLLEELQEKNHQLVEAKDRLVLTEKMASLGTLVAGVAHEINTPVGLGITTASLLEEKTADLMKHYEKGELTEGGLEKYLKVCDHTARIIQTNLNKAAELIRSFRQVSVEQTVENKRTFDMATCVREIVVSLEPKVKESSHSIQFDCENSFQVEGYPGLIYQIITNLAMNSLIHGFKSIKHGKIMLSAHREGNTAVLNYRDNGSGISTDTMPKIFDPFFTTNRASGSTGLGLHIVFNIVTQKMNGSIECDSRPGEGVCFVLKFPV